MATVLSMLRRSALRKQIASFVKCPRDICYCNVMIQQPEKTKITKTLMDNAQKCKMEYYQLNYILKKDFWREK